MIDNGMKLVQQIDALTYNSRQVLNALIRSCVQSGSSNGYTITRGDTVLTLDRTAIYRLYDFYQRWERESFDSDSFDTLLDTCNSMWASGGNTVTKAVATHAQMCYLSISDTGISTADMDSASSDDLLSWCHRVRDAVDKKTAVNSAPIPINLRTPLYDENLSTKSFSQYETYLFPMTYMLATVLGRYDDGETRIAGGTNWHIDASDTIRLYGNHVVAGDTPVNDELSTAKAKNYGSSKFNFSAGHNSYAFGDYAAAFNERTIAYGSDSDAFGLGCLSYGSNSFSSGNYNYASGNNSAVFGSNSFSLGSQSFAAGLNVSAGDMVYAYTLSTQDNTYETVSCDTVVNADGNCITRTSKTVDTIHGLTISDTETLRISVGDTVKLFNQYYKDGSTLYTPTSDKGYVFKEMLATVTKITRDDENNSWFVEVDKDIPVEENGITVVVGGYITRYAVSIGTLDSASGLATSDYRTLWSGRNSAALNSYVYAAGDNQTVVGAGNIGNFDARFIVGTGDASYSGTASNGLMIAPQYGIMSTSTGSVAVSVTEGDYLRISKTYRDVVPTVCNGASLSADKSITIDDTSYLTRDVVNAFQGGAVLLHSQKVVGGTSRWTSKISVGGAGEGVSSIYDDIDITSAVESYAGTVVISSGAASYVTADGSTTSFTEYMFSRTGGLLNGLTRGDDADGNMGIFATNNLEIAASNAAGTSVIALNSCGYIRATFGHLALSGNTYGALPATSDSMSHYLSTFKIIPKNSNTSIPGHSGFYYAPSMRCTDSSYGVYSSAGHVIMSNWNDTDSGESHYAGISIPDDATSRPFVWAYDSSNIVSCHALAYYSDINGAVNDINDSITTVNGKNGSIGGLVLCGFKPTDWCWDTDIEYPYDVARPLYIMSNKVSVDATGSDSLVIPCSFTIGTTSNKIDSFAMYNCDTSVSSENDDISSNAGIAIHNSKIQSDWFIAVDHVWTSMVDYYLNLSFHVYLPKNVVSIAFPMFLGGGTFTINEDLFKRGVNSYVAKGAAKDDDGNILNVYLDFNGQAAPGVISVTIERASGSAILVSDEISTTVSLYNIMTPYLKSYNSGDDCDTTYIISGSESNLDARVAAAAFGGKAAGDITRVMRGSEPWRDMNS